MRNPITLNRSWRAKMMDIFGAPINKLNAFLLSLAAACMLTTPTFCTGNKKVQFNTNLSEEQLLGGFASLIIKFAYIAGALVFLGGAFAYVWARKEEDSRGQNIAIGTCVTGILLIGFEGILKLIGIIK